MLSNHDIFAGARVWDQLRGNIAQYKLAAATYLLQPGTPFIYYGEEIGMAGVEGLPGDAPLRAPMSWTSDIRGFTRGQPFRPLAPNAARQNAAAQARDSHSLLAFYKDMLKLRNSLPSIAQGSYEAAFVDGQVMGFQRRFERETSLVLINYGLDARNLKLSQLPAHARLTPRYPRAAAPARSGARGLAVLPLPPQSVQVFRLHH
jgi:glycosidase